MRTYYFVGGPVDGQPDAFHRHLAEVGGPPRGWRIYPHATGDGQALHIVQSATLEPVLAHLAQFGPIYRYGPIVEVVPTLETT
jgi:hypothetical protein